MLVVDGNPLEDIWVLTLPELCLLMVVQGGRVVQEMAWLAG